MMKETKLIRCISVTLLICLKIVLCSQSQNSILVGGCAIDSNVKVCQCTRDVLEIQRTRVMPFGVSCIVYDDNVEYNRSCYDNRNEVVVHREKRFGEFAGVGSLVGGVFGPIGRAIGVAVGLVVDIICIFLCGKQDPPPENKPPYVKTPARLHSTSTIIAGSGKTNATVSWTVPTFYDKEDAKELKYRTTPANFRSNGMYPEGSHAVFFAAEDSKGLPVQTGLRFKIKVIRCGSPPWPEYGKLDCTNSDNRNIFGTKCALKCDRGYISPRSMTQCTKTGTWNPSKALDCKPIKCQPLPPIKNGRSSCLEAAYNEPCQVSCTPGFMVKGVSHVMCDASGNWGTMPHCQDTQPPKFGEGECPRDMQVIIDSPNNTASVNWDIPIGQDNSNEAVIVTEVHGYIPGIRFQAGNKTIKYTIRDAANNIGDSCVFRIEILSVTCQPPDLEKDGRDIILYDCPNLYTLGANCTLDCKGGYPLAGVNTISCLFDKHKKARWHWDSFQPFCKETNCTKLREPLNGAISCSGWTYGQMCIMQCQKGFDVPASIDGQFVCGTSTGKWRPSSKVPNCNVKTKAQNMNLPSEFYYYTDKCNSSDTNLLEIQENFVKALNSSKFFEYCRNDPNCQAKFVDISCGPTTSRRKRDIQPRSDANLAYIVNFEFELPFNVPAGKSESEAFEEIEKLLFQMADVVQDAVDNGEFDMPGLRVKSDSFALGNAQLKCAIGMVGRQTTGSCVGCTVGQFMSTRSARCEDCAFGSYQDTSNSIACKVCPHLTNTTSIGSTNISDCRAFCLPGHYSPTGLAPCAKCPSSYFQPSSLATSCNACPSGTRTRSEGGTAITNCTEYDVKTPENADISLGVNTSSSDLTVTIWTMFRKNVPQGQQLVIAGLDRMENITIDFSQQPQVKMKGKAICTSSQRLKRLSWTHVGIVIQPLRLEVFINGKEICYQTYLNDFSQLNNFRTIRFIGETQLSEFFVFDRQTTFPEMNILAGTCRSNISSAIINIDDLAGQTGVRVIIPSMCDAINECNSSPCGRFECQNQIGGFKCFCSGGFSGRQCEIPPNFCGDSECKNGATCQNDVSNYTCICPFGFYGQICEQKAVNGNWSAWSGFTACSVTCGGGFMTRLRTCDSPKPDPEGMPCEGNNTETEICNVDECPSCRRLRRSKGIFIQCNESQELQSCTIGCRPGLYFADPPLPVYECGLATGYKWNHENENNPTGRLQSCSELKPPSQTGAIFDGHYDTIPCNEKNIERVKLEMTSKLSQMDCVKSGHCIAEMKAEECTGMRKRRPNRNGISLSILMKSSGPLSNDSFNIVDVMKNTSEPTSKLIDFIKQTIELEKTAQKLVNESVDFFQVTIDHQSHTVAPGPNGLTTSPHVFCPKGTAPLEVFCAESPIGTFSDGKSVIMCPTGQYQDEKGQESCKFCPKGTTTEGIGSINVTDCKPIETETQPEKKKPNTPDDTVSSALKIGVGVSLSILLLVMSALITVIARKKCRRRDRDDHVELNDADVPFEIQSQPDFEKSDL
ncbi:uncharacterized protein LOC128231848 isoform X3 [Mya arenaria]|uniref:uncharacterized protein LOC128231848 isoform X3 n=1 Tax=Mya arenaria TaxID=6604 RepID=UPI0022E6CFCB|nr:uncharacterized protein LOC128231848 isoform X3 [Mya arenaria]